MARDESGHGERGTAMAAPVTPEASCASAAFVRAASAGAASGSAVNWRSMRRRRQNHAPLLSPQAIRARVNAPRKVSITGVTSPRATGRRGPTPLDDLALGGETLRETFGLKREQSRVVPAGPHELSVRALFAHRPRSMTTMWSARRTDEKRCEMRIDVTPRVSSTKRSRTRPLRGRRAPTSARRGRESCAPLARA